MREQRRTSADLRSCRAAEIGPLPGRLHRSRRTALPGAADLRRSRTMRPHGCPPAGPRSCWTSGPPRSPPVARGSVRRRHFASTRTSGWRPGRRRGARFGPRPAASTGCCWRSSSIPTLGDERIDQISHEDVNAWYDAVAPGRETNRAHAYSLLRTILTSAASVRPHPLIPYNPAHIRGAGNTKRVHHVEPATLAGARDDRRGAARPVQADGAPGRLVRPALRRTHRAATRRHRPRATTG